MVKYRKNEHCKLGSAGLVGLLFLSSLLAGCSNQVDEGFAPVSIEVLPTNPALPAEPQLPLPSMTPTATPTLMPDLPSPVIATTQAPPLCQWLSNTPADGSQVVAGDALQIKWQIRNAGTQPWTGDYYFHYYYGYRINAENGYRLNTVVMPDQGIEIKLNTTAPVSPGPIASTWVIAKPDGSSFCMMDFRLQVVAPTATPTITPSPTNTIPPTATLISTQTVTPTEGVSPTETLVPIPTIIPAVSPTMASSPAPPTGTPIPGNGVLVEDTRLQNDLQAEIGGSWLAMPIENGRDSSEIITSDNLSGISFAFTGSQIEIQFTRGENRGILLAIVDENLAPVEIDQNGALAYNQSWKSDPLPAGQHRLVLSNKTSDAVAGIDAVIIYP